MVGRPRRDLAGGRGASHRLPRGDRRGTDPGLAADALPERAGRGLGGTEPGALFRSEDGGVTYSLVEGLWNHPHRAQWQPGGGGLCMHTVLPHPTDPKSIGVAVSTGGFYRSTDAGASWEAANQGIRALFLPEGSQYPEFGQCVHKVAVHPSRPERLFLQHHFGVYRSDDFGGSWTSIGDSLPSDFGFPIVVHPDRPDTVYVFPLQADMDRTPSSTAAGSSAATTRAGPGSR
nr:hypothetical protein GCM10020093_015440 [Planobispora longispora]